MAKEIDDLFEHFMSPKVAEAYCYYGLEVKTHGINHNHSPVEDNKESD